MTEKLSVPQVLSITELKRRTAKIFANSLKQCFAQHGWTSRTGNLLQSCKTALLKTTHPVLNRPSTAPEELCHLGTTEATADQNYAMQPVVISRLLGSHNFILHCRRMISESLISSLRMAPSFRYLLYQKAVLCVIIYDAIYN